MTLAGMLAYDEDAFICDMAETYHIYDYRSVPCRLLGTLAAGLRDDSRIKTEMCSVKGTTQERLLASIFDAVNMLLWLQTTDSIEGENRPESVLDKFYESKQEPVKKLAREEYHRIRNKILKKEAQGG